VTPARLGLPHLGYGAGLRSAHYGYVLAHRPAVDWFEVVTENVMDSRGWPRHVLAEVAATYPVVAHGVSLNIGGTDPLDRAYLARLKRFADEVRPAWVSDHVCWTGVAGRTTHELVPLPFTEEALRHVTARVRAVQDVLERPLVLENPTSYVTYRASTMPEHEFLARLAADADCGLLVDVANLHAARVNHGVDPYEFLRTLPAERVVQVHLAGQTEHATHVVDTHDGPVAEPVWDLYAYVTALTGGVSTLVEWDDRLPAFPVLAAEVATARERTAAVRAATPVPVAVP
jgi:uncharacterized protein (UPF0276 family)